MAKNLKLNIKNTQIAQAINLGGLKSKLAKKKETEEGQEQPAPKTAAVKPAKVEPEDLAKEEAPRIKARSRSAFAEPLAAAEPKPKTSEPLAEIKEPSIPEEAKGTEELEADELKKAKAKPAAGKKKDEDEEPVTEPAEENKEPEGLKEPEIKEGLEIQAPVKESVQAPHAEKAAVYPPKAPEHQKHVHEAKPAEARAGAPKNAVHEPPVKLGPTGRHIKDLLPQAYQKKTEKPAEAVRSAKQATAAGGAEEASEKNKENARPKPKIKGRPSDQATVLPKDEEEDALSKKGAKVAKPKEFRDLKPARKTESQRTFDARDRHGLRVSEEEQVWRKKRPKHRAVQMEDMTLRPTALKVRIPISIKDLASEMKLKASQLIAKLFLQGIVVTLNDLLEDETTIQLLGHEFGCEISIDSSEEKRIRITDQSIKEEIKNTPADELIIRPPVVAFMGHVDHGKTSLIDSIRESNRAAGEAGAITQHIGAFRCSTAVGDIAILDTPGHEAFSAMRARGADVTDIVVLVIAGDEGIKPQTVEAIQHAKAANVTIVVALNKCDKPNFNAENVYRQLAEHELLPEAWGGQTITVNCSAVTGQGIKTLLEMLALQAEVLELKANPGTRARGTVLESEMHKGMGAVATVLVLNGTLKIGDALVFGQHWGRVKTMRDEYGHELNEATPSTPVAITGLSGLPEAGEEFIAVKNEREAREIAEARLQGMRQINLQQKKKVSMENLLQQASDSTTKKILNIVLRADVQGSLEALKAALQKIESEKADLNIIFTGVGEVTESDAQLAAASKAVILGFHTQIESHAESLVKQLGVQVRLHDIIYHAIDDVKALMAGLLDKIAIETDKGKAEVKATFKSSHFGVIAGCQVTEGFINRNHGIRVRRGGEVVWKGPIASLKRVKEDVREVQKGLECGILLANYNEVKEGDILESYEMTYITQEL